MNKYVSAVDLTVSKSRGTYTLTTAAGNYRPAINKFVPWSSAATFSFRAYIAGNSVVWDDYSPVR
ncbi:hypothetical protein ACIA49_14645 [Kribbella sp. NPDC051587]|uniref:hypothetical protein n=1 Tax=Kribbella sp. NPDC051587 TaxID=3364119 RepID=UPI0037B5814C